MRDQDLPLARYALIGDGRTAALVADDGAIDWLCHERFDGPAVLCRLLDRERGGYLELAPASRFETTRRYVEDTNVLTTELTCARGVARIVDCMPLDAPQGPVILRRIEGLAGEVELRVELAATFDFATAVANVELAPGGCLAHAGQRELALWCPGTLSRTAGGASGMLTVRAGEIAWVMITHGDRPEISWAERALDDTLRSWRRWSAHGRYPAAYAAQVRRSALALKLLAHSQTGAVIAAPTTSLPEYPGGCRNWDYRFCWLRDASWVVSALMRLEYHDESMAFLDFVESLELGNREASIVYDLDGNPRSAERELLHLRGYLDSRPVRIGNRAADQDQHDVYGEVVAAIHRCSGSMPSMRPLKTSLWKLVTALANKAAQHWRHPDHGLWEVRGRPQHFLASKLLCWTAFDRAVAIAERDRLSGPIEHWRGEREQLRRTIVERGFSPRLRAFTQTLDGPTLDASALVLPRYGVVAVDDARMISTVRVIHDQLRAGDGLLFRYLSDDGLPGPEGAFAACSFWLAECLAGQRRIDDAHRVFEHAASHASDLGLLAEEIDPTSGALLGNYPLAFTHLALIHAAGAIDDAESATDVGTRPR